MAEDLISSFISEKGKQELEQAISSLREMLSVIKEVNSNQITVEKKTAGSSSVLELKNNIDSLNKSQSEFSRTLVELKKQEDALSQTQAKLNASYYDEAKALAAAKVQMQERNKLMIEEARQNNVLYQARQKAAEAAKAAAAYAKEQEKLAIAQQKAAAAAAIAAQPYNRLNELHKQLVAHAQQLGARFGTDSKQFEIAANRANKLGKKLSEIDSMLGNHRRNVGNYASSWNGLNHQVGMVLRELPNLGISLNTFVLSLSNNLPMLFDEIKKVTDQNKVLIEQGKPTTSALKQILSSIISWQTALIVGVTLLTKYGDQLYQAIFGGGKAAKEAEEAMKKYDETIKNIGINARKAANEEIARLNVLTAVAKDVTQTERARTRAVKELQETYPATFGALKQQAILEGELKDAVEQTTQALLNRAAAQAAEKRFAAASETVYDLTLKERDALKELTEAQNAYNKAEAESLMRRSRIRDSRSDAGVWDIPASITSRAAAAAKAYDKITTSLERARKEQQGYLQDALDMGRAAGDVLFGKDPKTGNRGGGASNRGSSSYDPFKDDLKASENYINELSKLSQQRLRQEVETSRAVYQDETKSLQERLDAYRIYAYARTALARQEISGELEATQLRLDEIAKLESRANKTYTAAENKLLVQKQELETRKVRLVEQAQAEILKINADGVKAIRDIQQQEVREILGEQARIVENARQNESQLLLAENERFRAGKITYRQYLANIALIKKQADQIEIDSLISFLEQERDLLKKQGVDVIAIDKEITKLKIKNLEAYDKEQESSAKKAITDMRAVMDEMERWSGHVNSMFSAISGLYSDIADAQIQKLDQVKSKIDENLEKELKAIEVTTLNETEKTRKIAAAEQKAAAEKKKIDAQQLQQKRRAAIIDKAANVTSAISGAALMVINAFNSTPGAVWLKIAAAAAAGITGAAQVARAVAAPLPQFAEGTDNSPEGLAIVGEKGRELKITPKGEVSLTPGRATLDYLEKGTTIIPADRTEQIIREMGMYGQPLIPVRQKQPSNADVINALEKQTKALSKALSKHSRPIGNNYSDRFNWSLYMKSKINNI